ncbi:hypothetical protein RhiirA4_461918 [Rhizophagus irregularis]|uniref:Protein kinase domain-containing protein n=1 Tax=Rhizophagus irregularis TaxID=588596 RepID=A0A2I1GJV8_9GLOM|nr:hypothetical protein RhiirA4_461918 [Rhizophagus irregularis]
MVKYVGKGGFSSVYSALWMEGPRWNWDDGAQEWTRAGPMNIALKRQVLTLIRKIHGNLHGGNLLIEDEKVSARISDVGLYEPSKIKVLPLTWIQDNDPGKRPTASYLNENLEEWIILICDDPNPSKVSDKNFIIFSTGNFSKMEKDLSCQQGIIYPRKLCGNTLLDGVCACDCYNLKGWCKSMDSSWPINVALKRLDNLQHFEFYEFYIKSCKLLFSLLSGIFGTTSIVMNLCQYLDHHNVILSWRYVMGSESLKVLKIYWKKVTYCI